MLFQYNICRHAQTHKRRDKAKERHVKLRAHYTKAFWSRRQWIGVYIEEYVKKWFQGKENDSNIHNVLCTYPHMSFCIFVQQYGGNHFLHFRIPFPDYIQTVVWVKDWYWPPKPPSKKGGKRKQKRNGIC